VIWLWRRIPHPEKPASNGVPEIDFGIETEECLVLGEAKWNSRLGVGQGVARDRNQFDLRVAYCSDLGRRVLRSVRHWIVLGVGWDARRTYSPRVRTPPAFGCATSPGTSSCGTSPGSTGSCSGHTSPGRKSTHSFPQVHAAWRLPERESTPPAVGESAPQKLGVRVRHGYS